jgi:DNA-binding transcriptional MerR regulator
MAEIAQQIDIPNRALFKAAEVCELVKVQPYVLRSWEAEFKDLGVMKSGSSARVYRREDIERVLRIKHLLLIEGLTLAGVRRRLEEEAEPPLEDLAAAPQIPINDAVRERITAVKRGLRSLLDLLEAPLGAQPSASIAAGAVADFSLAPPEGDGTAARPTARRGGTKDREKAVDEPSRSASPRRKRSA